MHSPRHRYYASLILVQVGRQQTSAEVGTSGCAGALSPAARIPDDQSSYRWKRVEVLALGCALAGRVGEACKPICPPGARRRLGTGSAPRSQCDPWGRSMTVETALSGSRTLSGGPTES